MFACYLQIDRRLGRLVQPTVSAAASKRGVGEADFTAPPTAVGDETLPGTESSLPLASLQTPRSSHTRTPRSTAHSFSPTSHPLPKTSVHHHPSDAPAPASQLVPKQSASPFSSGEPVPEAHSPSLGSPLLAPYHAAASTQLPTANPLRPTSRPSAPRFPSAAPTARTPLPTCPSSPQIANPLPRATSANEPT